MLRRTIAALPALVCIVLFIPITASAQLLLPADPEQCVRYSGVCGDVNSDQVVNISDAVSLIQYIFSGGSTPNELWRCDVDISDAVTISDAVYLINYVFAQGSAPCQTSRYEGTNIPLPFRDCMEYIYDGVSTISFHHVNASYNCCPIAKNAIISVVGDTIFIEETEEYGEEGPCSCVCLYDMQFSFEGLVPGDYVVRVIEMNVFPEWGDPLLIFPIHVVEAGSGEFCVYREFYPWGAQ